MDYFTFDAVEGQSVLISLSIPAIDGQEEFAPVIALFGPGVEADEALVWWHPQTWQRSRVY